MSEPITAAEGPSEIPATSKESGGPTSNEDSSIFSATFGGLSGRLQKAVQRATMSPSTVASSDDEDNTDGRKKDDEANQEELNNQRVSVVLDTKGILLVEQDDNPSETESITTETSLENEAAAAHDNDNDSNNELPLMETKVQFLYGQLQDRERTIQQLQDDHYRTRQEFDVLERESAECMEELTSEIQELQDQLQGKEATIVTVFADDLSKYDEVYQQLWPGELVSSTKVSRTPNQATP